MASIFHMSQNAWLDFVKDVGIPVKNSNDCQVGHMSTPNPAPNPNPTPNPTPNPNPNQVGHMSTLFVAVNAGPLKMQIKVQTTPKKKKEDKVGGAKHDTSRHLCRHEWVELLVRVAVARYVLSKQETDVSTAVRRLP